MNNFRTITVFSLFLASTAVFSQDAYKCKVNGAMVIQNQPCVGTVLRSADMPVAKPVAAPESAAKSEGPIEAGKALCREQAPKHVVWKDPESVRLGSVFGGKMAIVDLGQVKTSGRQFFVEVNAKNSYGGYVGQKSLICYTSQDGQRIIKVDGILL